MVYVQNGCAQKAAVQAQPPSPADRGLRRFRVAYMTVRNDSIVAADGRTFAGADSSIESKIGRRIKPQPNGCWLFDGHADRYGTASTPGSILVHRFVYETIVGPIDDGCELHHTCLTPGCCNPFHLKMLTPKQHKALHARHRRAANPKPRKPARLPADRPTVRVGGKRRVLPLFHLDPVTGKYREAR